MAAGGVVICGRKLYNLESLPKGQSDLCGGSLRRMDHKTQTGVAGALVGGVCQAILTREARIEVLLRCRKRA